MTSHMRVAAREQKKKPWDVLQCTTLFYYAALLQSTGWLQLRGEFHFLPFSRQGVLDPGDRYLAETSARPICTAYDTVHAQPYVGRGRRGSPNELST